MSTTEDKRTEKSSALLSCTAILSPAPRTIGGANTSEEDIITYRPRQPAWHCSFSKDGTYLAVCYGAPDPCVRVWVHCDAYRTNNEHHRTTPRNGDNEHLGPPPEWELHTTLIGIQTRTIRCVAFAPIHKPLTLASVSFDGTVTIWEQPVAAGTAGSDTPTHDDWDCIAQLEGHDNEVKGVAWNATGSLLATCGRDKSVWIWECFLPGTVGGGGTAAGGSNHHADADFECVAVLTGHDADVKCVTFCTSHGQWGDGDEICLSASYDDTVRVWAEDAGDWYCAATIGGVHSSTVWTLAVSPSGRRLLSGSADGSLAIYKCLSASEIEAQRKQQQTDEIMKDGEQRLPQAKPEWKCVGKLPDAHAGTIYSVDYAPARVSHGRIVSGGSDNRIQIYREALGSTSGSPRFSLDTSVSVQGGDINCVCWHPCDGATLASAGDDGNVRIWNYKV